MPRLFDVHADLVPQRVYYNPKRQQYIMVLGRLVGRPGWVKARPALLSEIIEYKQAHRVKEAARIRRQKELRGKPINTVVDLSNVPVFWPEQDRLGYEFGFEP